MNPSEQENTKAKPPKIGPAHLDFFYASSPPDDEPSGYIYKGG